MGGRVKKPKKVETPFLLKQRSSMISEEEDGGEQKRWLRKSIFLQFLKLTQIFHHAGHGHTLSRFNAVSLEI